MKDAPSAVSCTDADHSRLLAVSSRKSFESSLTMPPFAAASDAKAATGDSVSAYASAGSATRAAASWASLIVGVGKGKERVWSPSGSACLSLMVASR